MNTTEKRLQELLDLVTNAPEATLAMSYKHCHIRNLASVVIDNNDGKLRRAFLAFPGHTLGSNYLGGNLTVGIHNHRYDIGLSPIFGDVYNQSFVDGGDSSGIPLHKWKFTQSAALGHPEIKYKGLSCVRSIGRTRLSPLEWRYLTHDMLHTIQCSRLAAWWVQEEDQHKDTTDLYTQGDEIPASLYRSYESRKAVIDDVTEFIVYAKGFFGAQCTG